MVSEIDMAFCVAKFNKDIAFIKRQRGDRDFEWAIDQIKKGVLHNLLAQHGSRSHGMIVTEDSQFKILQIESFIGCDFFLDPSVGGFEIRGRINRKASKNPKLTHRCDVAAFLLQLTDYPKDDQ